MEANRVRFAIDANVLINLLTVANPENDIDGKVMEGLKNRTLSPHQFENLPQSQKPAIIRDDYLGVLNPTPNGSMIYGHLLDIYNMLQWIKEGNLEVCITPTVLHEITDMEMSEFDKAFLRKYITIIKVDKQDEDLVYGIIDKLATEYANQDAMKKEYYPKDRTYVPTKDAYIMAEASVCGLSLITCDIKDFIHKDVKAKDYLRSDGIKSINDQFTELDLHFAQKDGRDIVPSPISLYVFNVQMKKEKGYWYAQELNINANNEISF